MKPLFVALALALAGPSAVAAEVENHGTHPFNIRDRYELRHFLDIKSQSGLVAAAGYALAHPFAVPAIAGGIFADKTERFRRGGSPIAHSGANGLRYLLQAAPE